MELVNNYGGVPLITRLFELDDPEMMIKRNTYEDCVDLLFPNFRKHPSFCRKSLQVKIWTGNERSSFGYEITYVALCCQSIMESG